MTHGIFKASRLLGVVPALVLGMACSSSNPADIPRACTLIGCVDGLNIELEPNSAWPAQDYLFLVDADGVQVRCTGAIPLPACSAGRALTCTPAGIVTIAESGCALPASAQGFAQITFATTLRPRRVRVSIVETTTPLNRVLATADLSPEFRTSQPNGPDCPPTCTQAQGRISVRF